MQTESEKHIESKVNEYAKAMGITQYKFTSTNWRGVPDRIYLSDTRVMFIEFKHPDAPLKFSPLQQKVAEELSRQGFTVALCNNVSEGCKLLNQFMLSPKL